MNPKLLLTALIALVLVSNSVLAIPGVPHAFYGYVTLDGQPAPDGTTVSAKIDGEEVASTTTKDGKYGYDPVFYVDDPNNVRAGSTINFFVKGVDTGETYIFANTKVTQVNLTATSPPSPPSPPSPSGPGGPGGPGLPPTQPPEEEEEECIERWVCSSWSECVDGVQTKTCEDLNNCGTEMDRPLETQPCTTVEEEEGEEAPSGDTIGSAITGMVTLLSNPVYALLLVLIVIAIILTIFRSRILAAVRRKKE